MPLFSTDFYKKQLVFVLFFIFSVNAAQLHLPLDEEKYVDSLKANLTKNIKPEQKAYSYFLLSDYYANFYRKLDTTVARKYLSEGKKIGRNYPIADAKYYFYEGMFHSVTNNEKSSKSFETAIEKFSKINSEEADLFSSEALFYYSVVQLKQKGYSNMVKILTEKAIPLAEKHKNYKIIGLRYTQLGVALSDTKEFNKANIYFNKAIYILEKNEPRSTELLFAYLNSVRNLCSQKKMFEAKISLDKATKLLLPYPKSSMYAMLYYYRAFYFASNSQNDQALIEIKKATESAKKFKYRPILRMLYFDYYHILKKEKNYTEAKLLLLNIIDAKPMFEDKKFVYNELSFVNEKLGNLAEALVWSRKYSKLNDSLYDSKLKFEINDLETKFRTSEKEKQIVKLSSEKAQKEFEISKKNQYLLLLGLTSVLFLSLGIFAFFYFKNKRKLAEQREINLQQKLKETEQREELKVTKAILDGEERERERIAKDLHDGLGGMLAGVKINFSTWSSNHLNAEEYEGFHKILNQLDSSVGELRRVARNLMPESLLNFGLEIALKDLCDFYMKNNLHIDFQAININKNLPLGVQINIYRIAQELLTNSVKHANANNILLQCSQSENIFFITLEDNGNGFQENNPEKPKSMGLKNLKNRVDYLQGKMEINSEPDAGTFINIELKTNATT